MTRKASEKPVGFIPKFAMPGRSYERAYYNDTGWELLLDCKVAGTPQRSVETIRADEDDSGLSTIKKIKKKIKRTPRKSRKTDPVTPEED